MKRDKNIMIRLSDEELAALAASMPPGEVLAPFARKRLLAGGGVRGPSDPLRLAAAFIVASLSPDITFEEALELFDEHVLDSEKGVANGLDQ